LCWYNQIMENEVSLDENNIIRLTYTGVIDDNVNLLLNVKIEEYVAILKEKNLPLNILADATDLKKFVAGTRQKILQRFNELDVNKLAVIGATRIQEYLLKFFAKVLDNRSMQIFDTEEEALKWLLE